jgi:methylated-DNA-[protein]-cysteine S-methyltransferase
MASRFEQTTVGSPVGPLTLEARDGRLTGVRFGGAEPPCRPSSGVLAQAASELAEYFAGGRRSFTISLLRPPDTTPFRNRVWDAMLRIPFGATRTYGDLAKELGSSARAVGGACGHNALPIFIPCHRVVAAGGLGGYSGDWEQGRALSVKRVLLDLERAGS